jgi:hypothetical protein
MSELTDAILHIIENPGAKKMYQKLLFVLQAQNKTTEAAGIAHLIQRRYPDADSPDNGEE